MFLVTVNKNLVSESIIEPNSDILQVRLGLFHASAWLRHVREEVVSGRQ